ncbi:MAG: hypothetical protein LiPW41_377 [Parcubacteria group bacterium LiPW_41]|nr:MAG: hypothetical protein LiPW41_377 [Parcubacteria group bacterium LiPW_41]
MDKKTIIWIILGVVVVAVVVLALTGSFSAPQKTEQTYKPGNVAAPGASAVSTSGIVVTSEGKAARNDAAPMSPEAPQESLPITDTSSVTSDAIDIKVTSTGITPKEFSVRAGAVTHLLVSTGDQYTHLFKFQDPSLSAIAVGIGPGDPARLMTFNAPTTKGTYQYFCDVPGHVGRGESGKMIVN